MIDFTKRWQAWLVDRCDKSGLSMWQEGHKLIDVKWGWQDYFMYGFHKKATVWQINLIDRLDYRGDRSVSYIRSMEQVDDKSVGLTDITWKCRACSIGLKIKSMTLDVFKLKITIVSVINLPLKCYHNNHILKPLLLLEIRYCLKCSNPVAPISKSHLQMV